MYSDFLFLFSKGQREDCLRRLTSLSRWSKEKFKSPCNFEESPYVAALVFSPLVIYKNVDIVAFQRILNCQYSYISTYLV
jgi:hypothetical protein